MNMVDKTNNFRLNYLVIGTKVEPLFLFIFTIPFNKL